MPDSPGGLYVINHAPILLNQPVKWKKSQSWLLGDFVPTHQAAIHKHLFTSLPFFFFLILPRSDLTVISDVVCLTRNSKKKRKKITGNLQKMVYICFPCIQKR